MKAAVKIIVLLLLVLSGTTFGQHPVFNLNRLSQEDTLLTGWTMFAGDDPQFANPSLDDSKWQPVELNQDIKQVSQLSRSGIIWLRLRVKVDSIFNDELLAAHIVQYTASEVYLNGTLIQKYGAISKDPKLVTAYLPSAQPFIIHLLKDTQNVIAVRVAYQPGIPYISYLNRNLPVFNLYLNREKAAIQNFSVSEHQVKLYVIIFSISAGTMLIIGFIYLVYFLFDRSKKVHLYYALCMLAFCLNALPIEVWGAERYGAISLMMWVFYFEGLVLMAGMLFLVLTIYSLFNYPRRGIIKMLSVLSVAMMAGMYTNGTLFFFAVSYLVSALYLLEGMYACVWAIRNHKKDAAIILTGVLFYLLISILSALIPIDTVAGTLLFYIAQMSFPIGMSFYLGIQSSLTNKQLTKTLKEVQLLSDKNIVQEKEKQQLLANQNELLEQQVTERTAELNHSLNELKSTQAQLIQSEKMASLGELTAGIAHEIQNPLNFVNNFSEVSTELVDEMNTEIDKGNLTDAKEIAHDLKQNLEKINHHGKRAGDIVKGMLQHSRSSSGQKELTDINALADEYLRLAYHGLRAKDKTFNATLITDYDESIGNINIIPQDMGRVILNLITNAFYAVDEKKKALAGSAGELTYEPTVSVSIKKVNDTVVIKVSDNGNGIPQNVIDKIFQPFFTTKPTGKGTGLGLSMSYDIVTKGHSGLLQVQNNDGGGATFIIILHV